MEWVVATIVLATALGYVIGFNRGWEDAAEMIIVDDDDDSETY